MKRRIKLTTFATIAFATGLAACGGSNAPSIDQVKEDFNSPSGSTKDKQSVAQAYQKQSSSSAATRIAGGGFVGGGLSTQAKGLERIQPRRLLAPLFESLAARAKGVSISSLRSSQFSGDCFSQSDMDNANVSSDGTSGSFSFSKDLSTCTNGEVTGQLDIDAEFTLDRDSGSFTYSMDETLTNVCETAGDKYCVSGTFTVEMIYGGTGSESGSYTAGWFLDVSWDEAGTQKTMQSKGGLRVNQSGSGSSSLEYLVYVKDSGGNEVSLVLSIGADGQGNATIKVTGSDGSISCSIHSDGSGSCDGDLTWDEAYASSLEDNADLMGY